LQSWQDAEPLGDLRFRGEFAVVFENDRGRVAGFDRDLPGVFHLRDPAGDKSGFCEAGESKIALGRRERRDLKKIIRNSRSGQARSGPEF
jgi:hypothetical protein